MIDNHNKKGEMKENIEEKNNKNNKEKNIIKKINKVKKKNCNWIKIMIILGIIMKE